ncbi:hypothetical protein F5B22DRAFT_624166 [Xylaria bambusicola]|uniref:uncharacterized protein n=1 Tax=Xylaria bambusicola TaxID=326684 RepID=UPI002007393C|nr:uncharacterized protein F5B22DRAFT_624166 [Xylaria bambusicola]KAI0506408.1 hypothetical protein F5B22DRAFT_624166 [Xylaria bambusicola]
MPPFASARGTDAYKGPVGPLRHRCPLCSRPTDSSQLLRCSACRGVRYCSREHQAAHRPVHKSICNKVKNARAKLAREEHEVRNATPDFMTPANAFETSVGHFWGILSTRDYMRARYALVSQLILLGTLDGVDESREHLQDMLRLCRSDNMGLRSVLPAILLRLDLDQECYDFIKWWETYPDEHYDWGDTSLPYLDLRGADVLEDPTWITGHKFVGDLNYLVGLLILKLKILVDVRNLKVTRSVLSQKKNLPTELRDQIERNVIRSPLSIELQKQSHESFIQSAKKLSDHIREIGVAIMNANDSLMFLLFEPDEALTAQPEAYSHGSWQEAALAIRNSYAALWETEGVIDLLNAGRACAAQDSASEISEWMEDEKVRRGRTAAEMLSDVTINRVWGYFKFAFMDSTWLGPGSGRHCAGTVEKPRDA